MMFDPRRLPLWVAAIVLSPSPAFAYSCDIPVGKTIDASTPIEGLRCRAQSGDKRAQLELGTRYETGTGVKPDLRRAKRLYDRAARDSVSRTQVYSPAVGNERYGRVVSVGQAIILPGLPQAAERSARLSAVLKAQ